MIVKNKIIKCQLEISSRVLSKTATLVEVMILLMSSICTIFIVGWVLWSFRFGFDFADEGFYLAWISNPFKYEISTTQFGYIYHPLYLLLDGNIALLRQINGLITFCLAWMLCFFALDAIFGYRVIEKWSQFVIAAAFSTAAICFLRLWIPTPSYNWLNFQALLIATIGLLLAERDSEIKSIVGWLLIGMGGWLAFMAKPSTAAALGVASVIYLLWAGKLKIRLLAISIGFASLLCYCFALIIDGSIIDFVNRLIGGAEQAKALSNLHNIKSIFRIDPFEISQTEFIYLLYFVSGTLLLLYLAKSQLANFYYSSFALISLLALGIIAVVFGVNVRVLAHESYVHMGLLSIPVSLVVFYFANSRRRALGLIFMRSRCSLILLLILMPIVFAFGSGNNYWIISGQAGLFWVLAGIVFLAPTGTHRLSHLLLSLGFAVQFMSVNVALGGAQRPYYQPNPVSESYYKIDIGRPGSTLIIPGTFGIYISDAVNQAKKAGFEVGTPMIDLTGHSPGVLYALGASSSGAPWIIGNFAIIRNAENSATQVLKKIDCIEISRAWLLLEPNGPVKISSNVLKVVGADLSKDFEVVGTFSTASMVGGFQEIQTQQLLRPTRPENLAVAACTLVKE